MRLSKGSQAKGLTKLMAVSELFTVHPPHVDVIVAEAKGRDSPANNARLDRRHRLAEKKVADSKRECKPASVARVIPSIVTHLAADVEFSLRVVQRGKVWPHPAENYIENEPKDDVDQQRHHKGVAALGKIHHNVALQLGVKSFAVKENGDAGFVC